MTTSQILTSQKLTKSKDNSAIGQDNQLTKTTKKIIGFGYSAGALVVN